MGCSAILWADVVDWEQKDFLEYHFPSSGQRPIAWSELVLRDD